MEVEKYIKTEVKLFTYRNYFKYFNEILLNLAKNALTYQQYITLSSKLPNNNYTYNSNNLWFLLMELIFDKINYNKIKGVSPRSTFINNSINNDLNTLIYSYLKFLCKKKLKLLIPITVKEGTNLIDVVNLYLEMCEEEIFPEKFRKKPLENEKSLHESKSLHSNKKTPKKPFMLGGIKFLKFGFPKKLKFPLKKKSIKQKLNSLDEKLQIKTNNINNLNNNSNESNNEQENEISYSGHKKYKIKLNKLTYDESLSRLFIGETDERSIKNKFLSGITVRKEQNLKVKGQCLGVSESFVKRIINEIYINNPTHHGVIVDENLAKTLEKFSKDRGVIDDYRREDRTNNSNLKRKIILKKSIKEIIGNSRIVPSENGQKNSFNSKKKINLNILSNCLSNKEIFTTNRKEHNLNNLNRCENEKTFTKTIVKNHFRTRRKNINQHYMINSLDQMRNTFSFRNNNKNKNRNKKDILSIDNALNEKNRKIRFLINLKKFAPKKKIKKIEQLNLKPNSPPNFDTKSLYQNFLGKNDFYFEQT